MARPLEELQKPVKVQGLVIPPPQEVPPFSPQQKPVFILETERQGRVVNVRGTTNLAVEGNGVQVSLFRVYREAKAYQDQRASLATRNLSLWFEGRFPVEDGPWFKAWAERAKAYPEVFPGLASLDGERVYVEVIFTAGKSDLGPVPGLTVYPLPGTDKQIYRIIRPVKLPLAEEAQAVLAQAAGQKLVAQPARPTPRPPARHPQGYTEVEISPLRWLDKPRQTKAQDVSGLAENNLAPTRGRPPVVAQGAVQPPLAAGLPRVSAPAPVEPLPVMN